MSGGRHWKSPRTESYVRHAVLKHAPLTLAQRAGHHFNGSRLPGTQEGVAILNFRVLFQATKEAKKGWKDAAGTHALATPLQVPQPP